MASLNRSMEDMMNRKTFDRSVIAASVVAVSLAGYAHFVKADWGRAEAAIPAAASTPSQAVVTSVPGVATATDFSGIVERYGPAVVNISVVGRAAQAPADHELPELDPND